MHDAGEIEAALLAYERALQVAPESAHFMTAKATLLFKLGRDETAEQAIDAAIASAPAVVSPHLLRVEQLVANGDLANALLACERYLESAGAECNMLAARAFLLHALGRADEAAMLMDYDGLISTSIISPPAGFADLDSFNAALTEHLLAHPSLSRQNASSKATQQGRQSGNLLFGERGPFEAFEQVLWRSAQRYVQELVRDPAHPFSRLSIATHSPDRMAQRGLLPQAAGNCEAIRFRARLDRVRLTASGIHSAAAAADPTHQTQGRAPRALPLLLLSPHRTL